MWTYLALILAALAGVCLFMIGLGALVLFRWWFGADRREVRQ